MTLSLGVYPPFHAGSASVARNRQHRNGACLGDTTTTSPILQVKPPKTQEARDTQRHHRAEANAARTLLGPHFQQDRGPLDGDLPIVILLPDIDQSECLSCSSFPSTSGLHLGIGSRHAFFFHAYMPCSSRT